MLVIADELLQWRPPVKYISIHDSNLSMRGIEAFSLVMRTLESIYDVHFYRVRFDAAMLDALSMPHITLVHFDICSFNDSCVDALERLITRISDEADIFISDYRKFSQKSISFIQSKAPRIHLID